MKAAEYPILPCNLGEVKGQYVSSLQKWAFCPLKVNIEPEKRKQTKQQNIRKDVSATFVR